MCPLVLDRRADAFAGFFDRGVGQADDGQRRHAAGAVDLHLDEDSIQAQQRTALYFGKHGWLRWWDTRSVAQTARQGKWGLSPVQAGPRPKPPALEGTAKPSGPIA